MSAVVTKCDSQVIYTEQKVSARSSEGWRVQGWCLGRVAICIQDVTCRAFSDGKQEATVLCCEIVCEAVSLSAKTLSDWFNKEPNGP